MEWQAALGPVLSPLGLDLYDVELTAGTLNVVVSRAGGVDLDALTEASRAVSAWLDAHDPIEGRYTLDVSSPGLERRLRTPEHFAGALGERVTLRERREGQATRRLEGTLVACDATSVTIEDANEGPTRVELAGVERARTVFQWGADQVATGRTRATTSKKG
ncbi:MAG TPA: ribosome maturation factor RimP [Acidimicrobiales bacterium]|nr:ribosome maturation factor RimP [Acidimicrobiales bacterium]